MLDLIRERIKQLEEQRRLDTKLKAMSLECPDTIVNFLLSFREANRQNALDVSHAGITQVYKCVVDGMKTETVIHRKAVAALESKNPCLELDSLDWTRQ
jgi:hypothetical protein